MDIVVATKNEGKVREFTRLFVDVPDVTFVSLRSFGELPDVPETGTTFDANAEKKARGYADLTGCVVLADDSGLVVDALGGAPGVYSARYAGVGAGDFANNSKLLYELRSVPDPERTARFVCVLALYDPSGALSRDVVLTRGAVEGSILRAARGTNGFGYDPLFVPTGHELTTAELAPEQKDALSHRGAAARAMKLELERLMAVHR